MFLRCASVFFGLAAAIVSGSDVECRDKVEHCSQRVKVNVSSLLTGLIDDPPNEVYQSFVAASSGCLQCVEKSEVRMFAAGDPGCPDRKCKGCGEWWENALTCQSCCEVCRCQGCDYNYGPGDWGLRMCEDCCPGSRRLDMSAIIEEVVEFRIDVCMDNIPPVGAIGDRYTEYETMLQDFHDELEACYADKDTFYNSWSTISSGMGIDLSTMARKEEDGGGGMMMFGTFEIDMNGAEVTVYDSSESHRSTSHMIFYGALGFVAVSAFAVVATAVVVKVMNRRRETEAMQSAKWISELTNVESSNPVNSES